MSKRHTYIESSSPTIPDWVLFQENLVFYAPLNQGELFDYISGEVGATSADAFVQWDANEGHYLLGYDSTPLGHDCTALRYTSQTLKDNIDSCYTNKGSTVMITYKDVAYTGRAWGQSRAFSCCTMKDVWETSPRFNHYIDGLRQGKPEAPSSIPSDCLVYRTIISVQDGNNLSNGWKIYRNGSLVYTYLIDTQNHPLSIGICDKNGHATSTSSKYNTSQHYIYAYDVRMYNRTMSASEVQQLYNAINNI